MKYTLYVSDDYGRTFLTSNSIIVNNKEGIENWINEKERFLD